MRNMSEKSLGAKLDEFIKKIQMLMKYVGIPPRSDIARLVLLAVIGIIILGGLGFLIKIIVDAIVPAY